MITFAPACKQKKLYKKCACLRKLLGCARTDLLSMCTLSEKSDICESSVRLYVYVFFWCVCVCVCFLRSIIFDPMFFNPMSGLSLYFAGAREECWALWRDTARATRSHAHAQWLC